ncbi:MULTISPECIES: hypothetical protein [Romboutsia]|uniref:Sulfite reductase (NADPH) n=1 Tax=Romboutsia hominis TaxID=1507512 RepID=A0A2P2BNL7_9FIRM|nr:MULTISPECIES: hypothetical protein [Romboutsia]MCH1959359.1 hypothetical protein [Romboutsia hominis]MCH1970257.1 hypothetical protein [Romboutsia hominis]CEI71985.1 sulfite reductase (NADPH) [Romboutsia hominis]
MKDLLEKDGAMPRLRDKVLMNLTEENALELVAEIVNVYENNAQGKHRLGSFIDKISFDEFKSLLNLDKYLN